MGKAMLSKENKGKTEKNNKKLKSKLQSYWRASGLTDSL